jgi:hypothetical protein
MMKKTTWKAHVGGSKQDIETNIEISGGNI